MKTPKTWEVGPTRIPICRRAGFAPILTVLTAGALAGCGSSSSNPNGGVLDEFLGTWTIDRSNSTFTFNCPTIFTTTVDFSLWTMMTFEPGTLDDLVETMGLCPFNFNVNGKVATVPTPDPFTGAPPVCRLDIGTTPGTEVLDFRPTSWKFNLLAPVKDKAPPAQMLGTANITHVMIGATGAETADPNACSTYDVNALLSKLANH